MSVTDLFSPEGITSGYTAAPVPASLGEVSSGAYDFMRTNINIDSALRLNNEEFAARDDLLRDRFGQEPFSITGIEKEYPNPTAEGRVQMLQEHQRRLDQWIIKGRQENPALYGDVRTQAEIEEAARNRARLSKRAFEDVISSRPAGAMTTAAAIGGSLVGGFTDPLNIATLPFGAGASRSILKAALIEGSLNMGVEALSLPQIMSWQKELGHKYGLSEAAGDLGLAFAGGAGLTVALRGAVPAIRKTAEVTGNLSQNVLRRFSENENLPGSVRDAAKYMSRLAHIDEGAPVRFTSEDSLAVHRDMAARTADAFSNYRTPDFSPPASGMTTLRPFSHEAVSYLSEKSLTRAALNEEPTLFLKDGLFDSRSAADAYIRQAAKESGMKRTDFLLEKDDSGKISVLRPHSNVMIEIDDNGAVRQFKSFDDAKAYAQDLKSKNEMAEAVSFHPEKQKSAQEHIVIRGASPDLIKKIKDAPDLATFFDPTIRARQEAQPIPAAYEAATRATENVTPLNRVTEIVDGFKQSELSAARQADFDRLAKQNPDMDVTLEDGRTVKISAILNEAQENTAFIKAMKGCALG